MRHASSFAVPASLVAASLALAACDREHRRVSEAPPSVTAANLVSQSELQPGERTPDPDARSPYEENAYIISEGKLLYTQMNCVGCHAHGGGGMGPPLMDDEWVYGSDPENIVATIIEGRPNGMPSFRGKLSNDQVWRIASYVRSMSGLVRMDARTSRDDAMSYSHPEMERERAQPRRSFRPPASERP